MNPNHTPPRSVRIPDDVWQAAKDAAERKGESVSEAGREGPHLVG